MKPWIFSLSVEERLYAAATLISAGKYGFPLTLEVFEKTDDFFVKLNIGLLLIKQKIEQEKGAHAVCLALQEKKERWMTKDLARSEVIAPCEVNHRADIAHFPEAVNQITRLTVLNELAMIHYPDTQKATLRFLKERPWGVTGASAALLLTEGDEEALRLIRKLLNDSSEKVRLQVALILGIWGSDPEALSTLQTMYPQVSRQQKEQILESLGHIGDKSSLPFLIERFDEPSQVLRLIAAAAVLQTLYH